MPALLATWEDEAQLRAYFLDAPAWGQVGIEGGANVTPVPVGHERETASRTSVAHLPENRTTTPRPRRTKRVRQPSRLLDPNDWVLN